MRHALIIGACIFFAQSAAAIGVDEQKTCGQGYAKPAVGQPFIDAIDCFSSENAAPIVQPVSLTDGFQRNVAGADAGSQSIPLPLPITMLTLSIVGLLVYRSLPAA